MLYMQWKYYTPVPSVLRPKSKSKPDIKMKREKKTILNIMDPIAYGLSLKLELSWL